MSEDDIMQESERRARETLQGLRDKYGEVREVAIAQARANREQANVLADDGAQAYAYPECELLPCAGSRSRA
jgi:hypothetical protein